MRQRRRTILRLEFLQIGPFVGGSVLGGALLALEIHDWLAWIILGVGFGSSTALAVVAARGSGPFSGAPLIVSARAKMWVTWVRSAAVVGVVSLVGLWLPRGLNLVLLAVLWLGFFIVNVGPLFGYGRLGRELTEAAKEEERASWRN